VTDGRPAGRSGAGLDDDGSDADGFVLPERTPRRVMHGHPEIAAPVLLRAFRHEGLVVQNHQCFRGLGRLAGQWELTLADGRILTAPAALPDLRPGETAAVPLPFELPGDGGETWVTLRVTTKDDEPWGARGTEVCAPRLRLGAAPVGPDTRYPGLRWAA
jgi:beta-galactosidase